MPVLPGSSVGSRRDRVTARSSRSRQPPPALVTTDTSRPFERVCACGKTVCGVRYRRTGSGGGARHSHVVGGRADDGRAPRAARRSCSSSSVALHARVGVEALHHAVVEQRVRQRDERHALVVGHEGAHDGRRRPDRRSTSRRLRARLVKSTASKKPYSPSRPIAGQPAQVRGALRRDRASPPAPTRTARRPARRRCRASSASPGTPNALY